MQRQISRTPEHSWALRGTPVHGCSVESRRPKDSRGVRHLQQIHLKEGLSARHTSARVQAFLRQRHLAPFPPSCASGYKRAEVWNEVEILFSHLSNSNHLGKSIFHLLNLSGILFILMLLMGSQFVCYSINIIIVCIKCGTALDHANPPSPPTAQVVKNCANLEFFLTTEI